ncbi:MAG: AAA family ATPase [Acidimicrobiales bacterium]|nr:AAA family ATPase [Acidimicrobiales bacterium]
MELEFAGRFPVRDFERPVELYVLHDGIESTAVGPLRIPTATRHKLVAPRTTFVGRVEELDDLALRLGSAKLVTVTGVGGIGKTRLVSELCQRHGASWFDGLCWVSLSQVSDPNLIEQSVLESIEPLAREAAPFVQSDEDASRFGRVLLDDVLNLIADKELLLVLDNCEHHRARIAALIDALLRHCPAVQVVATSREPLGLLDESVLRLRPLELGDAARLFLLRSGAVTADRAPNAELLELCNQLDCLPLAIELVAAHASNLPPQEITAMLRRFWFPSSADPSLDARQRTLSGMIGWSYALLSPAEQLALRRLTVLAAEFTLDTATATIRTDDGNIDAEEIVWALTRKSLLEPTPSQGTQRFRLLSTVRSVARSITPNPELLDAAMAAAQHLLACVGPDVHAVDHAVIERRQCELPNLRHLIDLLGCSDPAVADDLAWTIATQQRMTSAVAAATELYGYLTRHPRAGSRRIGLLVEAGRCAMEGGAVETAERFVDDARTLTEAFETPLCFDMELETLTAELYIVRGAPNLARQRAHSLLARARTTSGRARLLQLAGTAAFEAGDLREGRRLLAQALDLQQGIGDLPAITALHALLARAALGDGDLAVAVSHERAALAGAVGARDIGSMASAAAFAAQLASERGQHATAAALIGGADRVLSTVGRQLVPGEADRRSQLLRRLRTALGCGFAEALQAGSELDLEGLVVATHSVIERSG